MSDREALVSQVLGAASETLTLDELGSDVLPLFGRLIGAGRLLLYRGGAQLPMQAVAGDAECLPEYASFVDEDPVQDALSRRNPALLVGGRSPEWRDVRAHPQLAEFYDRWDLTWLLNVRLSATAYLAPGYTAIVCGRGPALPDYEARDLRAAAAVLPALSAAVRRAGRLRETLLPFAAAAALSERESGHALLALDLRGRLLWRSPAAEAIVGSPLPEPLPAVARQFAALAHGDAAAGGTVTNRVWLDTGAGAPVEAEVFLARTAAGEPFVAVDLGGDGVPPAVSELAARCGLTRAETEVLSDLVRGLADAEIAAGRFVAVATVRTHVTRLLRKLGARSRLHAVALALGTAAPADRERSA